MALNISRNHDELLGAWNEVVNDKSPINWAVFGYEGQTNTLLVVATGDGSLEEMTEHFSTGKCMYAFCRVKDPKTTLSKNVFIIWQGEGAPDTRKGICANHVRPISDLFKGAHVTLTARTDEEVDPEAIIEKVSKASSSKFDFDSAHRAVSPPSGPVGSVYRKTDASLIIKERDEYYQNQQKEDKDSRQQVEHSRRQSQQDEINQITRNRQAGVTEEFDNRVLKPNNLPNNPVQTALESKNYVNMERRKWEDAQKSTDQSQKLEKKPHPQSLPAKPPPKPPHQTRPSFATGNGVTRPSGLTPRLVMAPKKVNDPSIKAREDEEKRRWEEAQREAENEDRERRLKAEVMRQERLKEAQALISGRRQSEDLSDEQGDKTRSLSRASSTTSSSKPRALSNASHAAGDDVATQAYREEERRRFEEIQKESEKDEHERRHRSENLRQERLRELAALTQNKDSGKDTFSSIGQTVKEKRSGSRKEEDPELVARRNEEKRRWEESQRESQADEMERRNKAEILRQQRAEEAAALVAHRSAASGAKAVFEQKSPKQEAPPAATESRSRTGSAQQVAKSLFEHSPASSQQQQHSHSKVPLTPQSSQSDIQIAEPESTHQEPSSVHPSQRALPPLPSEENGHSPMRSAQVPSGYAERNGANIVAQSNGHDHHVDTTVSSSHNGKTSTETVIRDTEQADLSPVPLSPVAPAVHAWKQGLPVRPPSDDEADAHDEDDWNDAPGTNAVKSPTLSSNSSSGHSLGLTARALYDYQAADETEISFDPGDVITQIDKVDSGWYQGMAPDGTYGLFPANYVEMLA